jgi:hypothetical protein
MKAHPATWYASPIPWSKEHPEAFAGTHEKHVLLIFDEASAVDDIIWETAEGAMTTPGALWIVFGNPTRSSGRFKECFPGGRFAHRWQTFQVDSRSARMTDKAQLAQWVTDYGDDSDFVRVRVKGMFPRQAVGQFISEAAVEAAAEREPVEDPLQPTIIGVDVARYGDDRSAIVVRQGAQLVDIRVYREIDTVRLAGFVCEVVDQYRAEEPTVCIDGVGLGAGVVDVCQARGYQVEDVQAGRAARDSLRYHNLRAEMWDGLRQWVESRASLDAQHPEYQALKADLCAPEYGYNEKGQLQMERKAHMKARGLASPDLGDAVALTFAVPVAPKHMPQFYTRPRPSARELPRGLHQGFWFR